MRFVWLHRCGWQGKSFTIPATWKIRWPHTSVTFHGCLMKRYKIKDYSVNAELEINYTTNGRWIVILVDGATRKSVGLFRWWWQCQLLLWSNPDLPLIRKGRAAHKWVWGNVDSGMIGMGNGPTSFIVALPMPLSWRYHHYTTFNAHGDAHHEHYNIPSMSPISIELCSQYQYLTMCISSCAFLLQAAL